MRLMLITSDPRIARYAVGAGVDRIFVDLETRGKQERQGHLDTHMAAHTAEHVRAIRNALPDVELLARINPLYDGSSTEVEDVLAAGADVIMLPMFTRGEEVKRFADLIRRRAQVSLLLETPQALARIDEVLRHADQIDEIHVGLNDLHLGLKLDFMFELLSGGLVEYLAHKINNAGVRFGFGGVARVGEGAVPAELVLSEHVRLGSEMVILSRAFHGRAPDLETLRSSIDFPREIARIRKVVARSNNRHIDQLEEKRRAFVEAVQGVVKAKRTGL